jgi:hypothetical protein
MAHILYPNGNSEEVHPANGRYFDLKEMQKVVGGSIEHHYLKDGRIMTLNQNGLELELPRNEQATAIAELPTPSKVSKRLLTGQINAFLGPLDQEDFYIPGTVLVSTKEEAGFYVEE